MLEHAVWYYAHHLRPAEGFAALQCVLPLKRTGLFPWDDEYPPELHDLQPLFGAP